MVSESITLLAMWLFSLGVLSIGYIQGFLRLQRDEIVIPNVRFMSLCQAFLIVFGIQAIFLPMLVFALTMFFGINDNPLIFFHKSEFFHRLLIITGMYFAFILLIIWLKLSAAGKEIFFSPYMQSRKADIIVGLQMLFLIYPLVISLHSTLSYIESIYDPNALHIDQLAVKEVKNVMHEPVMFFLLYIGIVFIVPLMEEILFRGFLLGWLMRKTGTLNAIALSSLVFALFHYAPSQGVANYGLLISLFVFSLFLGFLYIKRTSLLPSYIMHAAFNAVNVALIVNKGQ